VGFSEPMLRSGWDQPDYSFQFGAHRLIPSTTLGDWTNTNSVLSAVSAEGGLVSLTMANPAAARDLPTTGASYVFSIRDILGRADTYIDGAQLRYPAIRWSAALSVPADCWVGVVLINASTVAGATVGHGVAAVGNGVGSASGYHRYTAGWLSSFGASFSANGRGVFQQTRAGTGGITISTASSSILHDSAGAFINGTGEVVNRVIGPVTHVALCCGWAAGTGAGGSVIQVRPALFIADPISIPGLM
jgi:hypothetical protein